jgi:hypothetical protein
LSEFEKIKQNLEDKHLERALFLKGFGEWRHSPILFGFVRYRGALPIIWNCQGPSFFGPPLMS